MSREDNIAKHRLGVAKLYLSKIKEYNRYYGSYDDYETSDNATNI